MSRKIILNLAISIDGYISEEDGSYDWIVGDGNTSLNTEKRQDFNKFLDGIDIVVMGKRCYDQEFHKDFLNKKVYGGKNNETLNDIILSIPDTADKINNTNPYIVIGYSNSKRSLFKGNNKDYFARVMKYDEKLELLEEK